MPRGFDDWVSYTRALPEGSAFSPESRALVLGAIARTGTIGLAARVARITPRTLQNWFAKGRDELDTRTRAQEMGVNSVAPTPYGDFLLDCMTAQGYWQAGMLGVVQDRADHGDVQAAQWLLKHVGGTIAAERVEIDVVDAGGGLSGVAERVRQKLDEMRARAETLAAARDQEVE